MTNEEALDELNVIYERLSHPEDCEQGVYSFRDGDYLEALDLAIKALEAQPSEDCISRQAVIDHICEDKECYTEECKGRTLKRCPDLQWVLDLPSVTPQRQKGKWIEVFVETPNGPYNYGFKSHKCSKCEYSPLQISNYCPNCGAEMSGGGEDEG